MIRTLLRMLFLPVIVVLPLPGSVAMSSSTDECKELSKRQLEETLGKPVSCPANSGEAMCFQKNGAFVIVRFDPSGLAASIVISTPCVGIRGLTEVTNQIVPETSRGKFLKRDERSERYACQKVYAEEYGCLSMEYSQNNCQGCVPAAIKIVWKHKCPKCPTPPNNSFNRSANKVAFMRET